MSGVKQSQWTALSDAIRDRRHDRGWTQQDLADRSGASYATVRLAESGAAHRRWTPSLTKIVRALDWDLDEARAMVTSVAADDDPAEPRTTGTPLMPASAPVPPSDAVARVREGMVALAGLTSAVAQVPGPEGLNLVMISASVFDALLAAAELAPDIQQGGNWHATCSTVQSRILNATRDHLRD